MALDKEHPKTMIVRIIFLFSVVRLKKPVIESLVLKNERFGRTTSGH